MEVSGRDIQGVGLVDQNPDVREYWIIIKRRRWQMMIPAAAVLFLAIIIAFVLPPVYKSTGTILIEAQEIPRDFVRTTVTGYVEERLQIITQIVLSRTRLLELINRFGLYEDLKGRSTTEEILDRMREDIQMNTIQAEVIDPQSMRPGSATIAFTLSYEGNDPKKVVQVANALTSTYLEENLKNREEKARTTFDFLESQLTELRSEISRTEEQIAEFKNSHIGELPELSELNLQTMERLDREIKATEEHIQTLVNRKIYLEGQLATLEPIMHTVAVGGTRSMTAKEELEALKSRYLALSAIFSKEHPDVIAIKKRIDVMESEVSTREDLRERHQELRHKEILLAKLSKTFSDKHPDVIRVKKQVASLREEVQALSDKQTVLKVEDGKPENPSYINLQTQITSTQMDIDSARNEVRRLRGKYEDYQERVEKGPQVEQHYRALLRDYTNAQAKYQETRDRLLAAREAQGLEKNRAAEKFTLVDPPVMPQKPDRPNRLAIIFIGFVLSIGTGVGFGVISESLDRSVRGADRLAQIAGYPVLATIPFLATSHDRVRSRRRRWAVAGSTAASLVIGLAALHFLYRPLDVLWIQLMRMLFITF